MSDVAKKMLQDLVASKWRFSPDDQYSVLESGSVSPVPVIKWVDNLKKALEVAILIDSDANGVSKDNGRYVGCRIFKSGKKLGAVINGKLSISKPEIPPKPKTLFDGPLCSYKDNR